MKDQYHEIRSLILIIEYARKIKAPQSVIQRLTELLKQLSYKAAV